MILKCKIYFIKKGEIQNSEKAACKKVVAIVGR